MDTERKEEIGERNRRRAGCKKCGSQNVEVRADLDDEAHFKGLRYKVCLGCGHEERVK